MWDKITVQIQLINPKKLAKFKHLGLSVIQLFITLSYDRSIASSKAHSPQSVI
jgi:hypothetical protein